MRGPGLGSSGLHVGREPQVPDVPGRCPGKRVSVRIPLRRFARFVAAVSLLLAGSPVFAADPPRDTAKVLAYHLGLTNGSELQVRVLFTGSNQSTTMRGVVHHLQTGGTCVFEERGDFRWWQTTLDFACGKSRLVLRVEFPDLSEGVAKASTAPSMVKMMVGDALHVWTVVGDKPQDTGAVSRGQEEVRKLPRGFQRILGELAKALLSPDYIAESAHAPGSFALLGELLEKKDLDVELATIRPLTTTEAEQLVRLAAGTN